MSQTYFVGDLQGCLAPLLNLLEQVRFNRDYDQLWCVGDLVNRGPQSLETLRFIHSLGKAAKIVLGNHDLHLLAVYQGTKKAKPTDTLNAILEAPDAIKLIDWLRQQPLLRLDHEKRIVMVHAGIPHLWTVEQAALLAREVEDQLNHDHYPELLKNMYGNHLNSWNNALTGAERSRCILNYLTRMRFIAEDGSLDLKTNAGPNEAPQGFAPWFQWSQPENYRIIFGHWAALMGETNKKDRIGLDTGCVWGQWLTLYHLEADRYYRASMQGLQGLDQPGLNA